LISHFLQKDNGSEPSNNNKKKLFKNNQQIYTPLEHHIHTPLPFPCVQQFFFFAFFLTRIKNINAATQAKKNVEKKGNQ